jgi:hypothetical protein
MRCPILHLNINILIFLIISILTRKVHRTLHQYTTARKLFPNKNTGECREEQQMSWRRMKIVLTPDDG